MQCWRQELTDRERAHHEARLQVLRDLSSLFEQPADRHVAPPLFRLPPDDSGGADGCPRSARVARSYRSSGRPLDQLDVELAELSQYRVELVRSQLPEAPPVRLDNDVCPSLKACSLDNHGYVSRGNTGRFAEVDDPAHIQLVQAFASAPVFDPFIDVPYRSGEVIQQVGDIRERRVEVRSHFHRPGIEEARHDDVP